MTKITMAEEHDDLDNLANENTESIKNHKKPLPELRECIKSGF